LSSRQAFAEEVTCLNIARIPALRLVMFATAALLLAAGASGADFPEKTITLVVPYPAGGTTDTLGRILAKGLSQRLGQAVIVQNKGGGGTVIGAGVVAHAAPDGYTLLISSNSTFTLNPALSSKLPYDPLKSFESIGTLGSTPLVLLANLALPANSVKELVALAKARPSELSYASFGVGTSPHFAGEMFKSLAGIDITHVPYRGEAPALQDLIGGQVQLSFSTNVAALPQIRAGTVKVIAVTSARPSPSLPNVPSIAQSGYAEYEMVPWFALVAPLGLPVDVKRLLNRALVDSLADPSIRGELQGVGLDVDYQEPSAYATRVSQELPLMRAYAFRAGMQTD
jgi:tripartite-type tricarboxylate transporter receptor subunit TctC